MDTADFGDVAAKAVTYGISKVSPLYGLGFRMKSLSIDTSKRPYITFDDGAATHNCIKFGTGNDESMYWDGTDFLIVGATEVTGVVKVSNQELNVGTFSSATAGSGIPLDGNTAVFRAYGDDDGTTDLTGSRRVILGRMLYTIDQDGGHTMRGVQGQLKAADTIDFNHANNVISGVEGYIELAGTSARTIDGRLVGVRAALEEGASGTTTIDATGIYAGFEAALNSTRTYTNNGVFAAFMANISGGTTEWPWGVHLTGVTSGIYMSTVATGIAMTGAVTQVFDFTSATTAVLEDNKAFPDKAGSIKILTPAGATAYINYYDGSAS